MTTLICICVAAFFVLLSQLRKGRCSLGLPLAYLYSLLLIHLPGAYAHAVGGDFLVGSDLIEHAMRFTAVACVCFVVGVILSRAREVRVTWRPAERESFWLFCLVGGWFFAYGLSGLNNVPSIGAAIQAGSAVWLLGVLLGLRQGFRTASGRKILFWFGAMLVFPFIMLLTQAFLSYGSTTTIIAVAGIAIATRSYIRVVAGIVLTTLIGLSMFTAWFQHRDDIRTHVWGGQAMEARLFSIADMASDFRWFDPTDPNHILALDDRLNQNYFVGLAAQRIETHQVEYLKGRSLWEGLISLVPRWFWPDKPVTGGSQGIVAEMTGLELSPTTSFGVGNVMEFQINFGFPGVIVGFLVLGWAIGWLDLKASAAEMEGNFGQAIMYFLPAVALIQPNGSIVELTGCAAAALVAAFGWRLAWRQRDCWKLAKQKKTAARKHRLNESPAHGNESPA